MQRRLCCVQFGFPGSAGSQAVYVKAKGALLCSKINCSSSNHGLLYSQPENKFKKNHCKYPSAKTHYGSVLMRAALASLFKSKSLQQVVFGVFRAATVEDARTGVIQPTGTCRHPAPATFPPFPAVPRPVPSSRSHKQGWRRLRLFLHGAAAKCQTAGDAKRWRDPAAGSAPVGHEGACCPCTGESG